MIQNNYRKGHILASDYEKVSGIRHVFVEHLQRMKHANRERLLLRIIIPDSFSVLLEKNVVLCDIVLLP